MAPTLTEKESRFYFPCNDIWGLFLWQHYKEGTGFRERVLIARFLSALRERVLIFFLRTETRSARIIQSLSLDTYIFSNCQFFSSLRSFNLSNFRICSSSIFRIFDLGTFQFLNFCISIFELFTFCDFAIF